jgi:hypothetical protein
MRSPFNMILPLLLTIITTACHNGGSAGTEPVSQTRVRIDNSATLDMDIYVLSGNNQISRLGFAPASRVTTLPLPNAVTSGSPYIRFQARPVRGSGESITSETFGVIKAGDELTWKVPAQ